MEREVVDIKGETATERLIYLALMVNGPSAEYTIAKVVDGSLDYTDRVLRNMRGRGLIVYAARHYCLVDPLSKISSEPTRNTPVPATTDSELKVVDGV